MENTPNIDAVCRCSCPSVPKIELNLKWQLGHEANGVLKVGRKSRTAPGIFSPLAEQILGTVSATLGRCSLRPIFCACNPALMDCYPVAGTTVANRRRFESRPRTRHFGALSLRPPSYLYVDAICVVRHRPAGCAVTASLSRDADVHRWH